MQGVTVSASEDGNLFVMITISVFHLSNDLARSVVVYGTSCHKAGDVVCLFLVFLLFYIVILLKVECSNYCLRLQWNSR